MSVSSLRKAIDTFPKGASARNVYLYLGMRDHFSEPPVTAKAYGTAALFADSPAYLYDDDLLAGSVRGIFGAQFDDKILRVADTAVRSYGTLTFRQGRDHFAPDFSVFLRDGIAGTLQRIGRSRETHAKDAKKARFLDAMKIAFLGFAKMAERYAVAAREKAERAASAEAKARFSRMADDVAFLLGNPPSTFRQALQLLRFCFVSFELEGRSAMAYGRLDQYLYPFYEKDVAAGILSREEAVLLLTHAFLKIGEHRYYGKNTFGGSDVVNICIGGITRNGGEGVNELSYCILEAVKTANIAGPNLSARMHKGMPDRFLDECLKVIATGIGYPALMNDEVNIPALSRYGYAKEDVNDYCFVGCIENFIAGKQPPWSDSGFNVPVMLESVFFRGNPLRADYIGVDTGDLAAITTMASFLSAFKRQIEYGFSLRFAIFNNENNAVNPETYAQPYLSVYCRDCIGRGLDIRDGGAVYPSAHGFGCRGMATVADSLAVIEKFVFNEKKYTLQQIADAMRADYVGYEEMRREFLDAPKYGNDDVFADQYAVWFVDTLYDVLSRYRTRDGGPVYVCTSTNINNISAGAETSATPDGRLGGEAVSDTSSPMHGMDKEGPTAVVLSVSRPDFTKVSCGSVVNQKFSPSMLNDDEKRAKVRALLKVYFAKGGQQMQINSVSHDVLKDAMKHPERYGDLVVRVSGFSAYFVNLDRAVQLDILKRTEHDGTK